MKTPLIFTWILLLALTLAGPMMNSGSRGLGASAAILLAAATLKFFGITHSFMELRHAHFIWRAATVGFAAVMMLAIGVGYVSQ